MNKPNFPASSHVLLQKAVSRLLADPESWLLPSPASFPGLIALKCPCFFLPVFSNPTTLQSTPSDVKSFMTTPRPRSFSLTYLIISDMDLFAHTETVKRKSCTGELIWLVNSIWKRNQKVGPEPNEWKIEHKLPTGHPAFNHPILLSPSTQLSPSRLRSTQFPSWLQRLSSPCSPELIGLLGYNDLFERYIGNISILTIVYSRAIAIREIREGVKQKERIRGSGKWEVSL